MLAKRLPLLSAFAVGCLTSAALIGFWRTSGAAPSPAVHHGARDRTSEPLVAANAAPSAISDQAHPDRAPAPEATLDHGPAGVEPPTQPSSGDTSVGSLAEPGSSVVDTLAHLEAAYRQALAVADLRDTAPSAPPAPAPPGAGPSVADREPAAPPPAIEPPPPPSSEPSPQRRPARAEAAVAVADTPAPPKSTLQADTAAVPPEPPPLPPSPWANAANAFAPPDAAPPRDAYAADTRPNVYIGNINQGDVYQVQQLAILQYIQLLAPMAAAGNAFPGRAPRGVSARRPTPFPSTLTNPDNPWGFDFHPPVLVK